MPSINKLVVFLLKWSEYFLKDFTFTMRNGLAKGLKRRYGFGFKLKTTLTKEEQFLMSLDFAGKTVFDVGGYVGILTLFFAGAVGPEGLVFTFEPNPGNFEELGHNISLNTFGNIRIFNVGFGAQEGIMDMIIDPVYPSRSTIKIERAVAPQKSDVVSVQIYALDDFLKRESLPIPDFVKIDAEGAELDIINGMQTLLAGHKPQLFVELHGLISQELIRGLLGHSYILYHIETDTSITGADPLPPIENGHLFCR